ncbi:hypothetical protein, conserved [Leishmania donovani]|uniref:Uncharacterized protein n=1 Tax=Leishmania donovani TaxID=5661 RepID=E9B7T3_LEIDO|nr:hypothetical protein, conserved [Leishmania donovani]AYU75742.1 hypothetical protein LdCL_030011600 [Leishmania donovani]CBZ31306.1 hypothetical protein, conserved [Leishmania donovani]
MRGKGHKRLAARSFQQWQKLHYNALCDRQMPTPLHATLRLPVRRVAHPPSSCPSAPASVDVQLATNSSAVLQWWQREYDPFLLGCDASAQRTAGPTPPATTATHVLASTRVSAHVGPPAPPLGYPDYIAIEARQHTEGVLRGETYAYHHAAAVGTVPAPPPGAAYPSPVKWIQQPLLDGFVAQRLTAHTGVTTGSLLDTRRTAMALGRQLPPVELSPFYAASALLDRWCLFGEAAAVVPSMPASSGATLDGTQQPHDAAAHHLRIAELALGAGLLSNYRAVWLNGAVLSHPGTGRSVLVVGPRRSGKTTLALHCLSAAAIQASSSASGDGGVRLTAVEHFFLASGMPVRRMLDPASARLASPTIFACSLPHHITVGLGAVLGTLRPNPGLAAAVELPPFLQCEAGLRAFLRNTDGVLWNMSKTYRVRLEDTYRASSPDTSTQWDPVVINTLAGVVLLDWNVEELASTSPTPVRNAVRKIPLHDGGVEELLKRAHDYMFHGHHLLRTVYDAPQDAPARLAGALTDEWDTAQPQSLADGTAPALHCIEGSVNFDLATQLIMSLLSERA